MALQVGGGPGDIFQMLSAHREKLSQTQTAMVKAAPEEQQKFLEAQFKLENESQLTEQISKFLRQDGEKEIMRNL